MPAHHCSGSCSTAPSGPSTVSRSRWVRPRISPVSATAPTFSPLVPRSTASTQGVGTQPAVGSGPLGAGTAYIASSAPDSRKFTPALPAGDPAMPYRAPLLAASPAWAFA